MLGPAHPKHPKSESRRSFSAANPKIRNPKSEILFCSNSSSAARCSPPTAPIPVRKPAIAKTRDRCSLAGDTVDRVNRTAARPSPSRLAQAIETGRTLISRRTQDRQLTGEYEASRRLRHARNGGCPGGSPGIRLSTQPPAWTADGGGGAKMSVLIPLARSNRTGHARLLFGSAGGRISQRVSAGPRIAERRVSPEDSQVAYVPLDKSAFTAGNAYSGAAAPWPILVGKVCPIPAIVKIASQRLQRLQPDVDRQNRVSSSPTRQRAGSTLCYGRWAREVTKLIEKNAGLDIK